MATLIFRSGREIRNVQVTMADVLDLRRQRVEWGRLAIDHPRIDSRPTIMHVLVSEIAAVTEVLDR